MSLVQVFAWLIATCAPVGDTHTSISGCLFARGFARATTANALVPAEMFAVPGRTVFVAAMPVCTSPSGGAARAPGARSPDGSRSRAPASVSAPAHSPAGSGRGSTSSTFHGNLPFFAARRSNVRAILAS